MIYIKHPSGNEEYAFKEDGKIKYIPIWTTHSIRPIQDDNEWVTASINTRPTGGARLADNGMS